ncbi:hypothetical protein G6L37_00775 [Agrobacterium rubi]|nr:hypothetical protein [Agrobacterium rubi]NTF23924.1 hypothetical protein [Agrobacterium rubi]
MSFEKNATPILRKIVGEVAADSIQAECPCEVVTPRKDATIRLRVARQVFGKDFRDNRAVDKFVDAGDYAATSAKRCLLSQEMLPFDGIGEDSFYLNEYYSDEGPTLSGFATLRSWDEYTHNTQEAYAVEDGRRPDGIEPYEGRLLWDWSRWLEDGRLVYGNLSVALAYIGAQLDEHGEDLARARYETDWIKGPEHGKKTECGNYTYDMIEIPPANGVLRFAAAHIARVAVAVWSEGCLRDLVQSSGTWVARMRREENGEINEDVVFSGVEAMDRARFRHWLADLSALPDGSATYREIETVYKEKVAGFMEAVFVALETAVAEVGDVGKNQWRELCTAAATSLTAAVDEAEGAAMLRKLKETI